MRDIIDGLVTLKDFKSLIYRGNEMGLKSVEALKPLFSKAFPNNLRELRIINCKIHCSVTEKLIQALNERSSLQRLALVNTNLSDSCMRELVEYIKDSRLTDLDISWNGLLS